jgi:hypothetical protein
LNVCSGTVGGEGRGKRGEEAFEDENEDENEEEEDLRG